MNGFLDPKASQCVSRGQPKRTPAWGDSTRQSLAWTQVACRLYFGPAFHSVFLKVVTGHL